VSCQFIVTDLYGVQIGEVRQATDRQVILPHLRTPTASFKLPLWSPLAATIMDTDTLLKCYWLDPSTGTRTLIFNGPVVSAQETGEGGAQSIAVNATGPFWRLSRRLIPGSTNKTGVGYGSPTGLLDLGNIARTIISDTNGVQFSGIELGTQSNSTSGFIGKWYLKNVAEAIAELAAGLNSFEFRVRPTEPTARANPQNWPRIGLFDCAPIIGTSRPDAVFEYGTTRANVQTYSRTVDRTTMLTKAFCSVQGWPDQVERDSANIEKYHLVTSTTSNTGTRGLFEEVVNDAGVLDDGLRQKIADFHIAVRKVPRQQIIFTPSVNARPAPFADYDVGDTVRARAIVSDSVRFDALFRIWGITINVDENGNESVDLELTES
jgi:hypothetical protein